MEEEREHLWWVEMGIRREDEWGGGGRNGGRQRKKLRVGGDGTVGRVVGGVYSRGGERENVGIIRHVNETGQGKKSTRKNQQSTMITSTSHSGWNHVYVMGRREETIGWND